MSDNLEHLLFEAKTRLQTLALVASAVLATTLAAAGAGNAPVAWKYIGPGAGGSMFGMAIHPANRKIMIFGGDIGACYRTTDGGKTWRILGGDSGNCPRATFNVRFHPKQPNIVWHLGDGVLKSTDAGATWKDTHVPIGTYCALGLDPDEPNIAYVSEGQAPRSVLNWTHGKVLKTVDGGRTWRRLAPPYEAAREHGIKHPNFTNFIIDPDSPAVAGEGHARVYLFGRGGLYRSDDAGATWAQLGRGMFEKVESLSICLRHPSTLYVCAHYPGQSFHWGKATFWRSEDGGRTFIDITPPYFKFAGAVAVNPFDSDWVYGCNYLLDSSDPKQKLRIVRSKDGGRTWENIGDSINCNRARHLFIDPRDPRRLFVLTRFAIIAGRDGDAPLK